MRSLTLIRNLALVALAVISVGLIRAPSQAAPAGVTRTALPSVAISFGEQSWTRPEFDFRLHGGGAQLLALPTTAYDQVLLMPFGYAEVGQEYEIERAMRFATSLEGRRKLFSLRALCSQLCDRGKQPVVYIPGWFARNLPAWRTLQRPERYRADQPKADGTMYHAETFPERLWSLLMYLKTPDGSRPLCYLAWDGSGGRKAMDSPDVMAMAFAAAWGFESLTEGHAYPSSHLAPLRSITTVWMALESPDHYLLPYDRRALYVNNSSGIGRPWAQHSPGRHVGTFGYDHRDWHIGRYRDRGHAIYISIFDFGPNGEPPVWWDRDPREQALRTPLDRETGRSTVAASPFEESVYAISQQVRHTRRHQPGRRCHARMPGRRSLVRADQGRCDLDGRHAEPAGVHGL